MAASRVSLVIVCAWLLAGPGRVFSNDDLLPSAKKEAEVNLYLSTNLTDANGLIALFKQKYSYINVNLFRADT